ncbi:uncharacterized protein EV422DRAFT_572508 [Fimicolochytrium jonesii]|uniref:uncharacterized protein n=1 Tax=Fimicolochytrium jonesii TaxID=1396493 RepID=UPI0022FF3206|nr:uncharacterized protein EV422DRAFT_572508 [Fimicolochytrium jonesii]KAI8815692.1 hypothetical protein EV422DRAFT_572508 [Fimicolochytrium jonesii]
MAKRTTKMTKTAKAQFHVQADSRDEEAEDSDAQTDQVDQGSHAEQIDEPSQDDQEEEENHDGELNPQGLLELMAQMESNFADVVNETREQAAADKAELLARQADLLRLVKESHAKATAATLRLERLLTQQAQQNAGPTQSNQNRAPSTFSNIRPVHRTLASPAPSHLPSPITPPELQNRGDTTGFVDEGPIAKSLREGLATFDAEPTILTWEAFKEGLRTRFIPANAEEHALLALERLTQTGSIDEYYQKFSTLLLEVPEMTDKQACCAFRKGLRQGIQRLLAANPTSLTMSPAELVTLADSVYSVDSARRDEASRDKRPPLKQWPPSNKRAAVDLVGTGPATKRLKKLTNDERQRLRDQGACFRCRQPGHMQSDCPKYTKARIQAITSDTHKTTDHHEDPQTTQGDFP